MQILNSYEILTLVHPDHSEQINEIIERSVTKAPEHYLWHHRRFKSQAPEIYD